MIYSLRKKKDVYRSFSVKLWAKAESKLWLALRVDPCKTDKCMLHLYRCVLSIPRIVFLESMCIVKRILFLFLLWFLCASLCVSSLFVACSSENLSCPSAEARRVFFTWHCCILWEFIFCPLMKADTGTKLVSVWSWSHNKAYWIICTFYVEGGEKRRVIFFSFFLCSTLQRPLSLFSYCISTEYGVDIKIL